MTLTAADEKAHSTSHLALRLFCGCSATVLRLFCDLSLRLSRGQDIREELGVAALGQRRRLLLFCEDLREMERRAAAADAEAGPSAAADAEAGPSAAADAEAGPFESGTDAVAPPPEARRAPGPKGGGAE